MLDPQQVKMAQALRRAGYRLTRPRLAVLQVLQENDESLSPEEIYRQGKAIYRPLGLVTVYRTLELLAELGLARRVHSALHCHGYASAGADRHYLICQDCHHVLEFPCEGLDELIAAVQAQTGYDVTQHLLELSGVCPSCRQKQA